MIVKELIEELKKQNPMSKVYYMSEGQYGNIRKVNIGMEQTKKHGTIEEIETIVVIEGKW